MAIGNTVPRIATRRPRIVPDLLAQAKAKRAQAIATKAVEAKHVTGYDVQPDYITYTPKTGKNAGKAVVKVGFRTLSQPDNAYMAIKLYPSHYRAIKACIEAGHGAELEALMQANDDAE